MNRSRPRFSNATRTSWFMAAIAAISRATAKNARAPRPSPPRSGLTALTRDESFTPAFLQRHQDKLVYGSDCSDLEGHGEKCQGAQTIAAVRRFASSKKIECKLLYGNAKKLFRL